MLALFDQPVRLLEDVNSEEQEHVVEHACALFLVALQ